MNRDTTYDLIRDLRVGVLYFAIVFTAGFILGTLRVLFVVEQVGVRSAELIEIPFMLAISFVASRWLIHRFTISSRLADRITIGAVALGLLLIAEFGFVLWLQHMTFAEYVNSRDPVSGTAYVISLLTFAIFPLVVSRKRNSSVNR